LTTFFTTKGSQQSEKVTIAELAHIYHGVKHHISFFAQDCAVNVMKQVFQHSEIVKKMCAGRTKTSAIVNSVLAPFSHELVLRELFHFRSPQTHLKRVIEFFFPVGVQYFIPEQGVSFRILDFYGDAFEDSQSIKNRLCRVIMDECFCIWS
jgi:hypothetical protein